MAMNDKPLRELGHPGNRYVYSLRGEREVIPIWDYSAEERRELVRRVWEEALKAVITIDDPIRAAAERYFQDFIKHEGL